MTGYRGNNREPGYLARSEVCQDAIGLSLAALDVLTSVMAFTVGFHRLASEQLTAEQIAALSPTAASPTRSELYAFLGITDLHVRELVGGRWLTDDTATKTLTARARAWQTLGFSRDERRSA